MRFIGALLTLLLITESSRADEGLPEKTLASLKDVTVFIRVEVGKESISGSGFLMTADGKTSYVVTNQHVACPTMTKKVPMPPGRSRIETPSITVVFRSGTKQEQSSKADVVALDEERDLAILKVAELKDLPKPIDINQKPKLMETMPVYVLGFPFGKALSLDKGNPAISVGKGSISSLRNNERDEVALVQLDSALNPGNSGGPVVDSEGRLVGIAVATIKGSGLGLAIPSIELIRLLEGRTGTCHFKSSLPDKGRIRLELETDLVDPRKKLRDIVVHYVPTEAIKDRKAAAREGLDKVSGAGKSTLTIDGEKARCAFELPMPKIGDLSLTYQLAFVNGEGKTILSDLGTHLVKRALVVGAPSTRPSRPTDTNTIPTPTDPKAPAVGDADVHDILNDLGSKDILRRHEALKKLQDMKPKEDVRVDVIKMLEPLLEDSEVFIRRGSASSLGIWGTEASAKVLVKYVGEQESDVFMRRSAIEAIGKLKFASVADEIAACVPNFHLRDQAARALRSMGSGAEKAVGKLLGHTDLFVRMEACRILMTIGTSESLPSLESARKDSNRMLSQVALEAVKQIETRSKK